MEGTMLTIYKITIFIMVFFASSIVMSEPDEVDDFARQFMNLEIQKSKSSLDKAESWGFISKKFIRENNINTETTVLNSFNPDRYEIIGKTEHFVDVKIFNEPCVSRGGCFGDQILRLAIVHEDGHLALLPYGYKKGAKHLDFWWQNIQGKYEPLSNCQN